MSSGEIEIFKHILFLDATLKPNFFFLQIGGHDGVTFDATLKFAQHFNWEGIVLEPQPKVFAKLEKNYAACPRVRCLNLAGALEDGDLSLFKFRDTEQLPEHATMLASCNRSALEQNGHGYKFPIEEIRVRGVSMNTLCRDICTKSIDFLQTDTESFDYYLIRQLFQLDCDRLPSLIRFENYMEPHHLTELIEGLRARGYDTAILTEHGAQDVIATKRKFDSFAERIINVG